MMPSANESESVTDTSGLSQSELRHRHWLNITLEVNSLSGDFFGQLVSGPVRFIY